MVQSQIFVALALKYNNSIQFSSSIKQKVMIDSCFGWELTEGTQKTTDTIVTTEFEFFCEGKSKSCVTAELYEKRLILKFKIGEKMMAYEVGLDFQFKFELLREKSSDKGKWSLDEVNAIKFYKKDKHFELRRPVETEHLTIWRQSLMRKLSQYGFHEMFRPLKEIGRGAFASVYLVQNLQSNCQFAVKAFSKESIVAEENGMKGLINQIEIMRVCNHKNLMKIQGVYESKNSLYICVELLSGGQLYDKIKGKHKFSSNQIRAVMRGILSGLQVMHEKGFMHRDLKPQNILFREAGGECVIADFGLAENAGGQLMFVRCGTPGYVAPQIVNLKSNKTSYSTACDLFSLGVIFHILALGKSPFPGKTFDQVLEQNKSCKFNFETFQYNQLPPTWLSLLKGLLEKDPKKRLTAAQALNHQFFKKEPLITRNLQKLQKQNREPSLHKASVNNYQSSPIQRHDKEKKTSIQCNSPLMLTKNNNRKAPGLLRDDSCLKFKMKENILTGKIEEGKELQAISPLLKEKHPAKCFQSRFKRMAQQNS